MIIIKFKEQDLEGWKKHFKQMDDLINGLPKLPNLETQLGEHPNAMQIQEAHYLVNQIDEQVTHISQMAIALLEYIEGWSVLRKAKLMNEALTLRDKYTSAEDRKAYVERQMISEEWEKMIRAAKIYREILRKESGHVTRQKEQLSKLTQWN